MGKSLGNAYNLHDLSAKGFEPMSLRYLFLTAHYRKTLNFTWTALTNARESYHSLLEQMSDWKQDSDKKLSPAAKIRDNQFAKAISDDLSLPQALAELWDLVKDKTISSSEKYKLVAKWDQVFGLQLVKKTKQLKIIPQSIIKLQQTREALRIKKQFKEADKVRQQIEAKGYLVKDTLHGPKVLKS